MNARRMLDREFPATWTGLALIVAVLPLVWTWQSLTTDTDALVIAEGCALAVLATGIILRALYAPTAAVTLAQVGALGAFLAWQGTANGGLTALPTLLRDGATHLASNVAPVSANGGMTALLGLVVGVIALVADWLVIALERPASAMVPLLALLLVPALAPAIHRAPTWGMAFFALGMALVLLAASRGGFGPHRAGPLCAARAILAALLAASLALGVTLAVAPRIPVAPSARGANGQPITMADISLDLKRQIAQGEDVPALEYRTDGEQGVYNRLYSLPTFNADGWKLTNSTVQVGGLSKAPGLAGGSTRTTSITITGLRSEWLPAPYAPISTTAGDAWGYLPDSLSILALGVSDRSSATAGKSYTVTSIDARPSADEVAAVTTMAAPPDATLTASVPSDISPKIVTLTQQIIAKRGATTPGAKAQAILEFLAQPTFTYSLQSAPGSGYQSLENFLLNDHKGFCVQYAASMAVMARIAGIPSRVTIGFTPGTQEGDHWVVTMHDMHAWPELYLDGWGWVAFEPTPGGGHSETSEPSPAATTAPTTPTAAPSEQPTAAASPLPTTAPSAVPPGASSGGSLAWLGVLAALAVVLFLPSYMRGRRRTARLATGRDPRVATLDAWDEVRAITLDYGRPWPPGSPRFAAEPLLEPLGDDTAAEGVRELAVATELARFAGPNHAPAARDWGSIVGSFAAAVAVHTPSRWQRLRARLFPASLMR